MEFGNIEWPQETRTIWPSLVISSRLHTLTRVQWITDGQLSPALLIYRTNYRKWVVKNKNGEWDGCVSFVEVGVFIIRGCRLSADTRQFSAPRAVQSRRLPQKPCQSIRQCHQDVTPRAGWPLGL